mmetsp:Transcript_8477/g.10873  ORF Transcript_8477/g.10873 Transcript_8477/m.10873 type:complete len:87 (+) Transcript_8477:210-470(+)
MDAAALNNLSPEQKQAVMRNMANQVNQQVTKDLMEKMTELCFKKCAGISGDKLDRREQVCLGSCQDRYLDSMAQVTEALAKRQNSM